MRPSPGPRATSTGRRSWRARLAALQRALHSGGTRMGFTRNGLSAIVESLRGIGWQVADDGTATPPPVPAILRLLAPAWTTLIQKLLALFAEADAQTAAAVAAALGGAVPATPPGTLGDPRRPPAPGTGAEDVKKWWDSLSRAERAQLIAEHPGELGNLNGIPAEVRSSVNQAVLQDDLDRVTDAAGRHGVSTEEVLANPGAYGLTRRRRHPLRQCRADPQGSGQDGGRRQAGPSGAAVGLRPAGVQRAGQGRGGDRQPGHGPRTPPSSSPVPAAASRTAGWRATTPPTCTTRCASAIRTSPPR